MGAKRDELVQSIKDEIEYQEGQIASGDDGTWILGGSTTVRSYVVQVLRTQLTEQEQ